MVNVNTVARFSSQKKPDYRIPALLSLKIRPGQEHVELLQVPPESTHDVAQFAQAV